MENKKIYILLAFFLLIGFILALEPVRLALFQIVDLSGLKEPSFSGTDQQCEFIRGSKTDIYKCNSQFGCYAWIDDVYCSNQVFIQKVIARTNKNFGSISTFGESDAQIAVDFDRDGQLESNEGFRRGLSYGGCFFGSQGTTSILNFPMVYIRSGLLYVCSTSEAYRYIQDSAVNTNPNFLDSDIDGINVIKSQQSGSAYYCKFPYTNGFLEYSGDSPGYVNLPESQAVPLSLNEFLELGFSGTIFYKEKSCTLCECTKDVCFGTSIKYCTNIVDGCGTLSSASTCIDYPDKTCVNGKCQIPYTFDFDLQNEYGNSKTAFKSVEKVILRVYIDTKITESKTVSFNLYGGSSLITQKTKQQNFLMVPREYIYVNFGYLDVGNYKITAKVGNQEAYKLFSVSDEINIDAYFKDKTRFISNKEIEIVLEIYDSSGQVAIPIPDYKNNIKVVSKLDDGLINYTSNEIGAGKYEYVFVPLTTGMFSAEFEVNKIGYPIIKISKEHYIDEPSLKIVTSTSFRGIENVGEYDIDFDVKDESGNPIAPDELTIIIKADRGRTSDVLSGRDISGSSGEYSVRYYFAEEDVYQMEIHADREGYSADTFTTTFEIIKPTKCGDGTCNKDEDSVSCPQDCGNGLSNFFNRFWRLFRRRNV